MLRIALLFSLALPAFAQTGDEVRAVVVLARHGVRAPIENETRSSAFNALPWPAWSVSPGTLTPHGIDALRRMGEFYRQRYASLLSAGCDSISVESTNTSRTIASAKATLSAVVPNCVIDVHTDLAQDPATLDRARLADALGGRMGNQPAWFEHAFAAPLTEMHSILTTCSASDKDCKPNQPDFRATMLEVATAPTMSQPGSARPNARLVPRDSSKESAVALGADFAENFLLQYVEGLPMQQVGWGRVSRPTLDRLMEMNTRYHDFILRTPYYAEQAAGPLAERISSILRAKAHETESGTHIETMPDLPRFYFLSAHDANLTWLGGLLRIDWLVSDETFNATPPGSALVFELHHNARTNADTVEAFFIAQTLDQIRNLTPLTGGLKPSISPIYIPNCSGPAPAYACSLNDFTAVVANATRPGSISTP
ncbi:MAG: histidine-type phosphatase [Acidobacteria bacterium]|nr:histidine-type phosphatase [Acidobacteriota bacterium]